MCAYFPSTQEKKKKEEEKVKLTTTTTTTTTTNKVYKLTVLYGDTESRQIPAETVIRATDAEGGTE